MAKLSELQIEEVQFLTPVTLLIGNIKRKYWSLVSTQAQLTFFNTQTLLIKTAAKSILVPISNCIITLNGQDNSN